MEILVKCSNRFGKQIIDHFKNEHDDSHRYAYLMFGNTPVPTNVIIDEQEELVIINIE